MYSGILVFINYIIWFFSKNLFFKVLLNLSLITGHYLLTMISLTYCKIRYLCLPIFCLVCDTSKYVLYFTSRGFIFLVCYDMYLPIHLLYHLIFLDTEAVYLQILLFKVLLIFNWEQIFTYYVLNTSLLYFIIL